MTIVWEIVGALCLVGVGYRLGLLRVPSEAKARITAVEKERDAYKVIAERHEVTWTWPEGPVTRWEEVPELVDRRYEMTLDANLAALAKDLERFPADGHVELDVRTRVVGAWKLALQRAGWTFPHSDFRTWDEVVAVHRTFRGPPAEVQKELLEWFKDTTWDLYHKRDNGKYTWRCPADPIRFEVGVKRRVIEAPAPRPEIRFVEVPVAVVSATPAAPPAPVAEEERQRLAAMVEVEVAAVLAGRRISSPAPRDVSLPPSSLDAPPVPQIRATAGKA